MMKWHEKIETFIHLANKHQVKMILIGGGAVNFYGYQPPKRFFRYSRINQK